jgi:succinate dehydrogenase / fumarate reductase cytochrome b subunit
MSVPQESPPVAPTGPSPFAWVSRFVNSTIGGKIIVALTGLALVGFVLMHMLGNLQVFLGREALNHYAKSLKDLGPLLWVARLGLLGVLVGHVALAIRLKQRSNFARPIRYQFENTIQATWASRNMVLTGLLVLAFIVFHLAHYTLGIVDTAAVKKPDGRVEYVNFLDLKETYTEAGETKTRHDVYAMTIHGFRNPFVAIPYVIFQILLGIHLLHGTRSVFQTLGINHPRWNHILTLMTQGLTGIIMAGNIAMPLCILCGVIGADVK